MAKTCATEQTTLQHLVCALRDSLIELGCDTPSDEDLEKWSVIVHESMSAQNRHFHSVQHVFDISEGAGPLQTIAAMFHDTVYYNVDGGLSEKQGKIFDGVVTVSEKGIILSADAEDRDKDPLLAMVVMIFGFSAGQKLLPFEGENEFLSAVLSVRLLKDTLTRAQLAEIAACIEATIPFRPKACEQLLSRLTKTNEIFNLGLTNEKLVRCIQRAADLANRDVANFATTDRAWFLDNTWKLLPESNSALRSNGNLYTVGEYQLALKKMEGFFSSLDSSVIFRSFAGKPDDSTLSEMISRALRNVEIGRRYIRAKVLATSVIAALAQKTGGDAPISLFMGDLLRGSENSARMPAYLPTPERACDTIDEEVFDLLAHGRKSHSNFDLKNSPTSAYLYGLLGNDGLDSLFPYTVHPMDEENADKLLNSLPREAFTTIAAGCAKLAITRSKKLMSLAEMSCSSR